MWASVGGTDLEIDEEPEQVIYRLRTNGYDYATAAEEIGLNPGQRRELLTAAAWAGIARVALRRRDDAIRDCVNRGAPYREVAQATGLSHTAVGRVSSEPAATAAGGESPSCRSRWPPVDVHAATYSRSTRPRSTPASNVRAALECRIAAWSSARRTRPVVGDHPAPLRRRPPF